jgi:hypothetical protein
MRGRGGNGGNRKGPNPLTRTYESNGPDVKIRGTAQQIADKYLSLARDAQSAGDRVMAENYLQHAEHYHRIIAAAQAQLAVQPNRDQRPEAFEETDEDRDEDDAASQPTHHTGGSNGLNLPPQQQKVDASTPQPVIEGIPVEVALEQEQFNGAGERRANGAHAGSEEGDRPAGRRRGRPRRARGRDERGEEAARDLEEPVAPGSEASAEAASAE